MTSNATNVKVAVRIRPLTANELLADAKECVFSNSTNVVINASTILSYSTQQKNFTFDYVYPASETQEDCYVSCVTPLMHRFLEGYNATIVAYGQTGSGKTFTMGTGLEVEVLDENQGVVPRVIQDLFNDLRSKSLINSTGFKYSIAVSFLELYNEDLVDLLNPRPRTAGAPGSWGGLSIREDGAGNIIWSGVREEDVDSPEALMSVLQRGTICRTTGSTDMNASSSRSHAIFSIILKQEVWFPKGKEADLIKKEYLENTYNKSSFAEGFWGSFNSKFHFVDLAGSERLKRTNAAGDRKKEGISINQGLLSLGNVISALGDESRKSSYIPFRDSKLTRLLQDSLGGNSQTLMIACISPSSTNYGETLNTLNYANRARNIKNRVSVNQVLAANANSSEKEIFTLRSLVSKLKSEVATLQSSSNNSKNSTDDDIDGLQLLNIPKVGEEGSIWLKRQIQQHIQLQQNLESEMDKLRAVLKGRDFEIEKLCFFQARLYERAFELNSELSRVLSQRDAFLIESSTRRSRKLSESDEVDFESTDISNLKHQKKIKSRDDNEGEFPLVEGRLKVIEFDHLDDSDGGDDEKRSRNAIAANYLKAISKLRFQLADTEDKLSWYKNVFESLGNSKEKKSNNETNFSFGPNNNFGVGMLEEMGILTSPSNKKVIELMNQYDNDIEDERKLMDAMRDDPDMNNAFQPSRQSNHSISTDDLPIRPSTSRSFFSNETNVNNNKNNHVRASSTSMYLLVDKIQADIAEHEQIVTKLQKSELDYEVMKNVFEQKMGGLKVQLSQVQRERDLALQKMQNSGNLQPKEKAGSLAVKARFDKKYKQLELEISELRNKLALRSNSKSQSENLTKTLLSTIQSLKAEKALMTKKLKQEAEKNRELAVAKEKELEKFRLKAKKSDEKMRKLEKTNLKNSGDLTGSKIKSVMSILRRNSNSTHLKQHLTTTPPPPIDCSQDFDDDSLDQIELGSPIKRKLDRPFSEESNTPPLNVRAHFKKRLLEKELSSCIKYKRMLFRLEELRDNKNKLLGEQKDLLVERERCIAHDEAEGFLIDYDRQYYMDERLQIIDYETAMITSRILDMETELQIGKKEEEVDGKTDVDNSSGAFGNDSSWENASNILKSLDINEIQVVTTMFMDEAIQRRVETIDKDLKLAEKEKMVVELRAALENIRAAALKTSMQFEKKIKEIQEDAKRVILEASLLSETSHAVDPPTEILRLPAVKGKKIDDGWESSQNLEDVDSGLNPTLLHKHGNDPAIVAQAVLDEAQLLIPKEFVSPVQHLEFTNEELNLQVANFRKSTIADQSQLQINVDLMSLFQQSFGDRHNDRQRISRPQSAPILMGEEKVKTISQLRKTILDFTQLQQQHQIQPNNLLPPIVDFLLSSEDQITDNLLDEIPKTSNNELLINRPAPRRARSPEKIPTPFKSRSSLSVSPTRTLAPLIPRSTSLHAAVTEESRPAPNPDIPFLRRQTISVDDGRIWQDTLLELQKQESSMLSMGNVNGVMTKGDVFERLATRHTKSTFAKVKTTRNSFGDVETTAAAVLDGSLI